MSTSTTLESNSSGALPQFSSLDAGLPDSIPDYLAYYNLRSDPFAEPSVGTALKLGHNTGQGLAAYYPGAGRQALLDNLRHLILFSGDLLIVGGVSGVGKTRLCRQLSGSFDKVSVKVCSFSVQPSTCLEGFVRELVLALGLSSLLMASLGQMLAELRRFLQSNRDDDLCLLLIDDAHFLDEQSLLTLMGLLQGRGQGELERGVCITLFAEPKFLGRLAVIDAGDLLLHDMLLEAYDADELYGYLSWRFQCVGGELPYPDELLQEWPLSCDGDLNRIHQLAQQWLLEHLPEDELLAATAESELLPMKNTGLPLMHIVAITVLTAVLLGAYFFHDVPARTNLDEPVANRPVSELVNKPADEFVVRGVVANKLAANEPVSVRPSKAVAVSVTDAPLEFVSESELKPEPEFEPAPSLDLSPDVQQGLRAHAALQLSRAAPAASVQSESEPELEQVVELERRAELKPAKQSVSMTSLSVDERALMSAAGYTLQVLAAGSRDSIDAFVVRHTQVSLRVFTTLRQNRAWYVVVAGEYSSIEAARAGVKRLPEALRKAGPWPRSLDSIHQEIRTYRGI